MVMKTVQMTIDVVLLSEVDQVIQSLKTTRSAFIREALQLALRRYHYDPGYPDRGSAWSAGRHADSVRREP
jgi:hypothetical protein